MLTSCGINKGVTVDELVISYSSDVAPILDQKCVGCHGEIQPLAGLNLSTYAGIMKGSQGNPVVKIGEPNKSILITFDDVDICITMEIELHGTRVPRNFVLRKVSEKNLDQVNDEIENANTTAGRIIHFCSS